MSREKEIEEITKVITRQSMAFRNPNVAFMTTARKTANSLYNAGYRKIVKTDWLTKGISEEQIKREKDESLKEFFEGNCKKYGYCKQSEVAKEIFKEIEKLSHRFMNDEHYIFGDMMWDIAELKKKYTKSGDTE